MHWLIGFTVAALCLYGLLKYYVGLGERGRLKFWRWFLFSLLFAGVLYLTLTGRLHFLAAIATGLFPFALKLFRWLRFIPVFRRWYGDDNKQEPEQLSQADKQMNNNPGLEEAYRILGLSPDASRDEVLQAHKHLIQKVHPDQGGSDFLASQINTAKDDILEYLDAKSGAD